MRERPLQMKLEKQLQERSKACCELCGAKEDLSLYTIPPAREGNAENSLLCCDICLQQIEFPDTINPNHWRCLNDAMWSEHKPVQIMAWRMLYRLKHEGWPQDLLDMMYLDEETLLLAKATEIENESSVIHKDSNGVVLKPGDNVVLIKDLPVKGSSMVAKRGTAVRRISVDQENEAYIEGKVDGQHIVILTKYVKKI